MTNTYRIPRWAGGLLLGLLALCSTAAAQMMNSNATIRTVVTAGKPDFTDGGGGFTIGGKNDAPGTGFKVMWRGEVELFCQDAVEVNGNQYAFNVTYTMINTGPGDAANMPFHNKMYSDATVVDDWNWPAGGSVPVGVPQVRTAKMFLTPGGHQLIMKLDDGNAVIEGQEGNNQFGVHYTLNCEQQSPAPPHNNVITARLPDITSRRGITIGGPVGGAGGRFVPWGGRVKLTKADAFQESNGQFAFNLMYDMANIGGVPTSAPFDNRIYSDANMVSQQTGQTLAAGENKQIMTQAYLPTGRHNLTLRLDATMAVAEANEGNNSFTITFDFEP